MMDSPAWTMAWKIAFLLLFVFSDGFAVDTGLSPGLPEIIMELLEFKPCDGYEDATIVFRDVEMCKSSRTMLEINATVILKKDLDKTLMAKMYVTKCEKGDRTRCQEFPEFVQQNLCDDMCKPGTAWESMFTSVNVCPCPIPKGTYKVTNSVFEFIRSEEEAMQYRTNNGEFLVELFYYLGTEKAGCTHVEAHVEEVKKGKGKKK